MNCAQVELLLKSIVLNFYLIFCMIIQTVTLSILYPCVENGNIIQNIAVGGISFILSMMSGYWIHVASHQYDTNFIYSNITNLWTSLFNTPVPPKLKKLFPFFAYSINFHDYIHHNSEINKNWEHVIVECASNMFTQGIAIILLYKILGIQLNINGSIISLNYPIIFAWSLLYATIHNINYNIITPHCHIQHHINKYTNYGIDFMDIIFNTKYDQVPEAMNHASINIFAIMLLIIFIKSFCNPENYFVKFLQIFC